jgi:hypothetical protein
MVALKVTEIVRTVSQGALRRFLEKGERNTSEWVRETQMHVQEGTSFPQGTRLQKNQRTRVKNLSITVRLASELSRSSSSQTSQRPWAALKKDWR